MSPVLVTGRVYGFGYTHHVLAHFVLKCACVKRPDLVFGLFFYGLLIHVEKLVRAKQSLAEIGKGLQFGRGFRGGLRLFVFL